MPYALYLNYNDKHKGDTPYLLSLFLNLSKQVYSFGCSLGGSTAISSYPCTLLCHPNPLHVLINFFFSKTAPCARLS